MATGRMDGWLTLHSRSSTTCLKTSESSVFLTCRNDPNAEWAGQQRLIWTVCIYAAVDLRPPDQPMDDLTEHTVSSDTHHAEQRSKWNVSRSWLTCRIYWMCGTVNNNRKLKLTHQNFSALPLSSGDPSHDWHTPSLSQHTHQHILDVEFQTQEFGEQEVNFDRFTDDVCGDASLGEKWSHLLLVDAFALTLPPVRIDVDQQVFGSAGCKQQ